MRGGLGETPLALFGGDERASSRPYNETLEEVVQKGFARAVKAQADKKYALTQTELAQWEKANPDYAYGYKLGMAQEK